MLPLELIDYYTKRGTERNESLTRSFTALNAVFARHD